MADFKPIKSRTPEGHYLSEYENYFSLFNDMTYNEMYGLIGKGWKVVSQTALESMVCVVLHKPK